MEEVVQEGVDPLSLRIARPRKCQRELLFSLLSKLIKRNYNQDFRSFKLTHTA